MHYLDLYTHSKGHTLDWAFSNGIKIPDVKRIDAYISSHQSLTFSMVLLCVTCSPVPKTRSRLSNHSSAAKFNIAFNMCTNFSPLPANELLNNFQKTFSSILEEISSFKTPRKTAASPCPGCWSENAARRMNCGNLQTSQFTWNFGLNLRLLMKRLKILELHILLLELITTSPTQKWYSMLCCVIDLSPLDANPEKCEEFLSYFSQNISNTSCIDLILQWLLRSPVQFLLYWINQISLSILTDLGLKMKPSSFLLEILPVRFLKEVF